MFDESDNASGRREDSGTFLVVLFYETNSPSSFGHFYRGRVRVYVSWASTECSSVARAMCIVKAKIRAFYSFFFFGIMCTDNVRYEVNVPIV